MYQCNKHVPKEEDFFKMQYRFFVKWWLHSTDNQMSMFTVSDPQDTARDSPHSARLEEHQADLDAFLQVEVPALKMDRF